MSEFLLENLAEFIIFGNIYCLTMFILDWIYMRKLEKEKAASDKLNLALELKVMKLEKSLKDVTTILRTEDTAGTEQGSTGPDRQDAVPGPPPLDPRTTVSLT